MTPGSQCADSPLTPQIVLELRTSAKSLRGLGGGVNTGFPYILYLPADDMFCLHHNGAPQCKHGDPRVLGHMLRCERVQPGWIASVLSAAEPPDLAALDPAAQAAQRAAYAREVRRQVDAAAAAQAAATRRLSAFDISRISLDDLGD